MGDFPKPNDGKLGSIGRAVTRKEGAADRFGNPGAEYCVSCGCPIAACPGHYSEPKPEKGAPTTFMPTPFKTDAGK